MIGQFCKKTVCEFYRRKLEYELDLLDGNKFLCRKLKFSIFFIIIMNITNLLQKYKYFFMQYSSRHLLWTRLLWTGHQGWNFTLVKSAVLCGQAKEFPFEVSISTTTYSKTVSTQDEQEICFQAD